MHKQNDQKQRLRGKYSRIALTFFALPQLYRYKIAKSGSLNRNCAV